MRVVNFIMLTNQLTTSNNFIMDAVIDLVLMDLGLELQDLKCLDQHGWDMFEILCRAKRDDIRGAA